MTDKHWIDNADSYLCPVCGLEVGNPYNLQYCRCPKCGFQDKKDIDWLQKQKTGGPKNENQT